MATRTIVRLADQNSGFLTNASASTAYAPIIPTTQTGFRNLIINGDFRINQRRVTSGTADNTFCFDRWKMNNSGGTCTYTAQTFTPGNAIPGYEPTNYARIVTSGQSTSGHFAMLRQIIEDVRTLAGQTVTVSFWAKADSGTPKVSLELEQNFGSGGSPSSAVTTYAGQVTLSTSWARYSLTATMPSISGKTIGTTENTSNVLCSLFVSAGSDWNSRTGTLGIQSNTFDFWGVQAENGTIATPFEQRPIGTELILCQRYYQRLNAHSSTSYDNILAGFAIATNSSVHVWNLPVQMRSVPTSSISYNAVSVINPAAGTLSDSITLSNNNDNSVNHVYINASSATSPWTANLPLYLSLKNSTSFIAVSAEL
jgi:hypothetical protein